MIEQSRNLAYSINALSMKPQLLRVCFDEQETEQRCDVLELNTFEILCLC